MGTSARKENRWRKTLYAESNEAEKRRREIEAFRLAVIRETPQKTISTHRALQIWKLKDEMESRIRVSTRAGFNALKIGNKNANLYFIEQIRRYRQIIFRCNAKLK